MDIDTERSPLPYRGEGQGIEQEEQRTAHWPAESAAESAAGSRGAAPAQGEPSLLLLALLGLGIVTVIIGVVAFWFAGSVRRMEAITVQQQAALAAVQAQAAAEATQAAQAAKTQAAAQVAAQASAQATVQAATARLAEEQSKSAAYSRIVRANQLANNALLELNQHPQAALLLAIESLRMQKENGEAPLAESVQRLRSILGATGGMPLRTAGETTALAVSSDERWVAAGDDAGTIQLWDLQNLDTPPHLLKGHEGPVFDLAFGTNGSTEDATLYSAGADGTLRSWMWPTGTAAEGTPAAGADAQTVQQEVITGAVSTVPGERQSPLYTLAVSPDGSRLAAAGEDGAVALWQTGAVQADALSLQGHTGAVNTLAFSPDGRQLASAGNDGTVRVWSSQDGQQLADLTAGESSTLANFINLVVFSPDGKWLADGSSDGSVRLWRLSEGAGVGQAQASPAVTSIPLLGHAAAVNALAFSPDGSWLASGDDGGEVRLWNVEQPDGSSLLGRHTGNVRGLAFAEGDSGPMLVSTGYDGEVRFWNYRNPDADPLVVRGHDNAINALAAPKSGSKGLPDMLITAGYDGSLRVWHTRNPYAEPHQVLRAAGAVADVAVSPDGTQLASFTFDDPTIQLWGAQSGTEEKVLVRGDAPVSALAYSPARGVLWAGAKDGSITEWDPREGVLLRRWHAGDDAITTVAEGPAGTPAGSLLASGGEDSVIRLWDIKSGSLLRELAGHTGVVTGVAFSEDGKSLVSGGEGTGTLRIWDVATGAEKQVLQGPAEGLLDVAVQPHGPWLVGAGKDGAVWVWNADALAFEPARLSRHGTEVNAVNFSADGQVLASAGSDGAVYLWSTVNPAAEPDALAGHGNSVNGISFAPDGTWVVSGSGDGTIRRWSLSLDELIAEACHTAGRNFTLDEWTQYFPTDVSSYRKTCPNLPGPG